MSAHSLVKSILEAEEKDPCPFGLVHVSFEEQEIVAASLRKKSNGLLSDLASQNLAYAALVALRSSHFDWQKAALQEPQP